MRFVWKAAAMAALVTLAAAPAKADSWGISVGNGGVAFSYDSGGYCDRWGCPDTYWDMPIYDCPVFWRGEWYRGPVYYRRISGRYYYWLRGDWRLDEWRGARPGWACSGRYRPALGFEFYERNGFRIRDDWRRRWYREHGRSDWNNNKGWDDRRRFDDDRRDGRGWDRDDRRDRNDNRNDGRNGWDRNDNRNDGRNGWDRNDNRNDGRGRSDGDRGGRPDSGRQDGARGNSGGPVGMTPPSNTSQPAPQSGRGTPPSNTSQPAPQSGRGPQSSQPPASQPQSQPQSPAQTQPQRQPQSQPQSPAQTQPQGQDTGRRGFPGGSQGRSVPADQKGSSDDQHRRGGRGPNDSN